MIYLDYGATSFHKPPGVYRAVQKAMLRCASPGRGGYRAAEEAARTVFACRETAAELFDCKPEQVVLTSNCTHGLNIAIRSLVRPEAKVVVSGFEHNAVMRPLYALNAKITVAGRRLFDWEDTLEEFRRALQEGADAAVFTLGAMWSVMSSRWRSWRSSAPMRGCPSFWMRPSRREHCR